MLMDKHQNVELPFQMPRFTTYHFLASPGVVAKNNVTSDYWYFNHAIQIYGAPTLLQGDTFHAGVSLKCGDMWDMPFLEKEYFNTKFLRHCIHEVIVAALENGYYVYIWGIDDFYVEGKTFYKQRHITHDTLICGVNHEAQEYSLAAYDISWRYSCFSTSQKGVIDGIQSTIAQGKCGDLVAVRSSKDIIELDVSNIKQELMDYLDTPEVKSREAVLGMHVNSYLSNYLSLLKAGGIKNGRSDRRIFQFIWEHKKCMQDRIIAVETECKLSNEISIAYAQIVALADFVRLMYMRYYINHNDQILVVIQEKLKELTEREAYLLRSLCEKI